MPRRPSLQTAKPSFDWPKKPRAAKARKRSHLEERLATWMDRELLPVAVREFRFDPNRMWRFDFAWPARGLAVEIEGGVFIRGGHSRGADYTKDCEKYNAAAMAGWVVLRFTVKMFEDGSVFEDVKRALMTDVKYVPTVLTERT